MKKFLFFALTALAVIAIIGCSKEKEEVETEDLSNYVDLGLPSGTLWKMTDERNDKSIFFTYTEAQEKYGNKLPTRGQCQELIDNCQWTRSSDGSNYIGTGKNGNTIVFNANGYKNTQREVKWKWTANYWSSSLFEDAEGTFAYNMCFDYDDKGIFIELREDELKLGLQVRLVARQK